MSFTSSPAMFAKTPGPDKEASTLSAIDFSSIDEMDPSLIDGHHIYYEREVPFELRINEGLEHDAGSLEAIKVKILVRGHENSPDSIKVELTSETNLFFHYVHELHERDFRTVQEGQKLMVEFADYPAVLVRMLNQCIKEPHAHLAVFVMTSGEGRLEFIQNMEYKFVELLAVDFLSSTEESIRQHITFRYNAVKSRLSLLQARLADVNALVKIKNPSLLLQLQRTPPRGLPSGKR